MGDSDDGDDLDFGNYRNQVIRKKSDAIMVKKPVSNREQSPEAVVPIQRDFSECQEEERKTPPKRN